MNKPNDDRTELYTVRQFADRHPAFTESSLRWLIFESQPRQSSNGLMPGNGLDIAVVRIGRRVLIDEARFFEWIEDHRA